MSRSYKKIIHMTSSDNYFKKYANRRYRRRSIDLTNIPYKKYTDNYNIRDYISRCFGKCNWDYPEYQLRMK